MILPQSPLKWQLTWLGAASYCVASLPKGARLSAPIRAAALLALWLAFPLSTIGSEGPEATFLAAAGRGRLYRCEKCSRVERTLVSPAYCLGRGEPGPSHPRWKATPIGEGTGLVPTDAEFLFVR